MDSRPSSQPLRCLILVFVFVQFCVILSQNFDSLMQRVAFYPAPLMISRSPKPLTFYAETKLLNLQTVFRFTDLNGSFAMSDKSCSVPLEKFFLQLLLTVRGFQKVVRRLLSLPGFSTLVECDTYLPRYYQFMVGKFREFRVQEPIKVMFLSVKLGRYDSAAACQLTKDSGC